MKRVILAVFLVFALCQGVAFAGNVDTFGIGAKATALGGAFSAYADDVYAIYYNPAGLTQLKTKQISLGAIFIDPHLQAKNYDVEGDEVAGVTTSLPKKNFQDDSPLLVAPHLGFAMPFNEKISFGIAAYAPFGLHIKWNDSFDQPGSYNAYESWYQRIVATPTIAYKVNDKLSIGFGVSLGRSEAGTYLNSLGLYWAPTLTKADLINNGLDPTVANSIIPINHITAQEEVELTDDFNYSFNIGIMYKVTDALTLGVTYRSVADADFEGELKLKGLDQVEKAILAQKGLTKYETDVSLDDVDHPNQIQVGVRYAPHPKVSIEADLVWTQWSIVDYQTLEIKDPQFQALLGYKEHKIKRNWKDTNQVKIGVEYKATDILTLRCGYFYDPSPIPDDTFDIMWPDADKKTYSLGAGLNLGRWTVDAVVQYTITERIGFFMEKVKV